MNKSCKFKYALLAGLMFFLGVALPIQAGEPPISQAERYFQRGSEHIIGKEGPPNAVLAVQWWVKSEALGHGMAAYNLSQMYQHGEGVPQSDKKASSLLQKAIQRNVLAAKIQFAEQLPERLPEQPAAIKKVPPPTPAVKPVEAPLAKTITVAVPKATPKKPLYCGAHQLRHVQRNHQWINQQASGHYTLQLFVASSCEVVASIDAGLNNNEAAIYIRKQGEKYLYGLVLGSFASKQEAQAYARNNGYTKAWVRSFETLVFENKKSSLLQKAVQRNALPAKIQPVERLPEQLPEQQTAIKEVPSPASKAAPKNPMYCDAHQLKNVQRNHQWINQQPKDHYTLQLFIASNCEVIASVDADLNNNDAAIYIRKQGEKYLYGLVLGSFASKQEAQAYARNNGYKKSWVRSFESLIFENKTY